MTVSGKTDLLADLLIFHYKAFYTENNPEHDYEFTSLYVCTLTLSPSSGVSQAVSDTSRLLSRRLRIRRACTRPYRRTGCHLRITRQTSVSFTSHNKGLEAFFAAISQRRRQVESATRSKVVYGESIIYAYSKIIVINPTDVT